VRFSATKLYGAALLEETSPLHVCGYGNSVAVPKQPVSSAAQPQLRQAQNADDFGWDVKPEVAAKTSPGSQGNAMVIAIPAIPDTFTPDNLIPVNTFPKFLGDLQKAVQPREPLSQSKGVSFGADSLRARRHEPIVVTGFDNDLYDVVIASNPEDFAPAIGKVTDAKRPQENPELWAELGRLYPDWTFLLFCFEEKDAERAGSVLVTYKPQRPDLLYLPGLDGHEGKIEWGPVEVDHTLVVGVEDYRHQVRKADRLGNFRLVDYTDQSARQNRLLLPAVMGTSVEDVLPQGDFLFKVCDLEQFQFRCLRALPPGAPAAVKRDASTRPRTVIKQTGIELI
jgi:hypothetical protein